MADSKDADDDLPSRFQAAETPQAMLSCLEEAMLPPAAAVESAAMLSAVSEAASQAEAAAAMADLASAIANGEVTVAKADVAQAARNKKTSMPDGWWTVDVARQMRNAMKAFGAQLSVQRAPQSQHDRRSKAHVSAWVADGAHREKMLGLVVQAIEEGEAAATRATALGLKLLAQLLRDHNI